MSDTYLDEVAGKEIIIADYSQLPEEIKTILEVQMKLYNTLIALKKQIVPMEDKLINRGRYMFDHIPELIPQIGGDMHIGIRKDKDGLPCVVRLPGSRYEGPGEGPPGFKDILRMFLKD